MRKYLHIVLLLAVALSCRGPKLIPRDELEDIYVEMFLADQQLLQMRDLRSRADTMLVYEAIFNKHGFDTDDYLYTLQTNLKDPERFSKTIASVVQRLENEAKALDREIDRLDWKAKFLGMKRPALDTLLAPFGSDSLFVGLARVVRDSSSAAWFRLVPVQEDTLMIPVPADTLSQAADSLKHE